MSFVLCKFQAMSNSAQRATGLILLSGCLLISAWLSGGSFLLTRQLWMDEVHSWLLVTDPDPSHAMQALRDGVDFNPPTWFLVTRWFTGRDRVATELTLRGLSAFWMFLAVVGMYMLLTRRFSVAVSLTAMLLTMRHPLLIHQSTEIRFYGFWCAAVVGVCLTITWIPQRRLTLALQFLIAAVLSSVVATCHYFGILSLTLVCGAMLFPVIVQKQPLRSRSLMLAATSMSAGVGSLLLCLPFLIGQRSALSRPTWISPATVSDTLLFLQAMIPLWPIALCAVAAAVSRAAAKAALRRNADPTGVNEATVVSPTVHSARSSLLPLLSLLAMPLVIVLFAWCLQPALVTRYAIVGALGLAPLFALMLQGCSQRILGTTFLVGFAALTSSIHDCVAQWKADGTARDRLVQELRQCPDKAVLIAENRILWMPILYHAPELASRFRMADFEDHQLMKDSNLRIVQRDVARKIQKWYPQYSMRPIDSLAMESEFFVVPYSGGTSGDLKYPPLYEVEQPSAGIFRFLQKQIVNADAR